MTDTIRYHPLSGSSVLYPAQSANIAWRHHMTNPYLRVRTSPLTHAHYSSSCIFMIKLSREFKNRLDSTSLSREISTPKLQPFMVAIPLTQNSILSRKDTPRFVSTRGAVSDRPARSEKKTRIKAVGY